MAITQAIPDSFKTDIFTGVHTSSDVYKMALYASSATMDKTTTAYSATNEVVGTGYTAGGTTMSGFAVTLSGDTAVMDWTTDPSWTTATITARGALIYNSSKSNKAVLVIDFSADKTSTAGTFTVQLPTPDATNGLIRVL
jgi:hypothetical protein